MAEENPKLKIYKTINNMRILNGKINNRNMLFNFHSVYSNIGFLMNNKNITILKQNNKLEHKIHKLKRFKNKNNNDITVIVLKDLDYIKKIYNENNGKLSKIYKIYHCLCCIHDVISNKYYSMQIKQYKYYSNLYNNNEKIELIKEFYFPKTKLMPLDFEMLLFNYGIAFMDYLCNNYFNYDDIIKYLTHLLRIKY